MKIQLFQVDSFTTRVFGGNPAAVCPLEVWLPDSALQSIAAENNLSETAFFVPDGAGFHLRWFTPVEEIDLCGHATLAAAYVLFEHLGYKAPAILFQSRSGPLTVRKTADGYMMDFPVWSYKDMETSDLITRAFGVKPEICHMAADIFAVFPNADVVRKLKPDQNLLAQVENTRGIIATAPGFKDSEGDIDFVSRAFYPRLGIPEDPVTGSAHCVLTPYWAARLGKMRLRARQISARGGDLICELRDERVEITGQAVLYLKGEIHV